MKPAIVRVDGAAGGLERLQYRHYLDRAGGRLNNVVLITPNEQLSRQHERELHASGLPARLFSGDAAAELFAPVEIIDLNKLAERQGVKRVAVADFGADNLVLVDEGHLGASGRVWRQRRRELSHGGFTFEYSATFNQVVSGRDPELLDAYAKCLLFDYSYRRFHAEGYGKDYTILNLPGGAQDEAGDMYLLGCLLTFYQQCRIWRKQGAHFAAFNPAKPLWVFLGKTVTGASRADRATRSDVVRILSFLGWVLARGEVVQTMIEHLLAGASGLVDDAGNDFFSGSLDHLPRNAAEVYADLCRTVFHGRGRLHVVYLTAGEGELHLRTADHDPFGVVNVGDSAALYQALTDTEPRDFDVDRELGFVERLFGGVDRPDSTVNVVVGARRFIAGWNSWRVSTMGLMHVGVREGPEIIQMFGRGVHRPVLARAPPPLGARPDRGGAADAGRSQQRRRLRDDAGRRPRAVGPKGLSRFGGRERRKVRLHREIAEVERHVRATDPNLRLHAYVLSVTPAAQIDDGARSAAAWKRDGVYFLNDRNCLQEVITHALSRAPLPA